MLSSGAIKAGLAVGSALVMLILTLQGHSLSAQQPQYSVRYSTTAVPASPTDAAWNAVPSLDVPLIPQSGVAPALTSASVASVSVQALHDGERIAFRMVWDDATHDVEAGRPDTFRDSAAIQFPVGAAAPSICMGAAGQLSNIWHWKADWQEDIDHGFQDLTRLYPNFFKDYYPYAAGSPPFQFPQDFTSPEARAYSPAWAAGNPMTQPLRSTPVENLIAIGFGTLATHEQAEIDGRGVWQDSRWSVVFTRELRATASDLAGFDVGGEVATAFAVWNGSNEEVGARKQLSSFVTFGLEQPTTSPAQPVDLPAAPRDNTLILTLVLLGAFVVIVTVAAIVLGRDAAPDTHDGGAGGR
jgi:hypothetical protein